MEEHNNTTHEAHESKHTSAQSDTLMGVFAYLGPLIVVSFLVAKDDPFVKFHIKQGLVLVCIEIILSFLMPGNMMMWSFWSFYGLIKFMIGVLIVLGIINVVQKKERELPFIGSLASYFKF